MRSPVARAALRSVVATGLLLVPGPSLAQVTLVPPGLTPGSPYHLVFVTRDTMAAIPTDIAVYDAFVQGIADAEGLGVGSPVGDVTWKVIGSTELVDAFDHVNVAGPVYRLDGVLVANDAADLWDGDLAQPINVDEEGAIRNAAVNTGSTSAGLAASSAGTPVPLGASAVRLGSSGETDEDWIDSGFNTPQGTGRAFYALSEQLVVPAPAVPLPTRALLAVLVGLLLGAVQASRRRAALAWEPGPREPFGADGPGCSAPRGKDRGAGPAQRVTSDGA